MFSLSVWVLLNAVKLQSIVIYRYLLLNKFKMQIETCIDTHHSIPWHFFSTNNGLNILCYTSGGGGIIYGTLHLKVHLLYTFVLF